MARIRQNPIHLIQIMSDLARRHVRGARLIACSPNAAHLRNPATTRDGSRAPMRMPLAPSVRFDL
jgi:hypothetical protein